MGAIVGLGEILWDLLPAGPQLGGAPFNFAFHAHQLGHPAVMVSRLGTDPLGDEARAAVRSLGLPDAYLQRDSRHATGSVAVALADGQPAYAFAADAAYDHLAWTPDLEPLFAQARAVCFGTLGQRGPVARATIRQALEAARDAVVVFDINLRQHFYDRDVIEQSLALSRWVKLNDDELRVLRPLLGLGGTAEAESLEDLRRRYGLDLAALTRGADGCLVRMRDEVVDLPGIPVQIVDTVGAGDAFTAGLLVRALEGSPLREAATFANRLAARVASAAGGTPTIDRAKIEATC